MARYLLLTPAEQNQYDQRHKQILDLLRQLAAVDAAEVSKLSAKMVELSLQETHRDPSLRDTITDEHGAVRSPLLWPSTNVQRSARPPFEKAETMEPVEKAIRARLRTSRTASPLRIADSLQFACSDRNEKNVLVDAVDRLKEILLLSLPSRESKSSVNIFLELSSQLRPTYFRWSQCHRDNRIDR